MASQNQSMAEGLNKIVGQIAQLAMLPDADFQFLTKLQMVIKQQIMKSNQAGHGGPGMPGGGGPSGPGADAGPPPSPGPGAGAMPPGGPGGPPMPPPGPQGSGLGVTGITDPDELRRALSGAPG